jgi:putative peptidoglycan lipid II flippase
VASPSEHPRDRQGLSASTAAVATGMLVSKVAGLVRTMLTNRYLGLTTISADAFNAALRIPNLLQNLLGDGAMSASLIPVYVDLLGKDRQHEADRIARAVLGVLAAVTAVVVLVGVTWPSWFVDAIAFGFKGEKRQLTIVIVRILFPGVGLLVMSAWCLAVLNSHRRFLLGYIAPVAWNAAMIAALLIGPHDDQPMLAIWLGWASVVGALLQLGVQAPTVWSLMAGTWRRATDAVTHQVRKVLVRTMPVVFTRGVVQVSSYIDLQIASFLHIDGAVSALTNAQLLYQLPVSLFGMAVSAAALPSMSAAASDPSFTQLRARLRTSRQIITVLVVPSVFAFLALGDVIIGMLFQHGKFYRVDTLYVWGVLAGSAVGLVATTLGRLYSAAFYATGDTRTPTIFATIRVVLVTGLGYVGAMHVPSWIGVDPKWGAAGLTVSAGIAGWVEFTLLSRGLAARVGALGSHASFAAKTWAAVLVAGAIASLLRFVMPVDALVLRGVVILGVYGLLVLAAFWRLRLFETGAILKRLYALRGRRS